MESKENRINVRPVRSEYHKSIYHAHSEDETVTEAEAREAVKAFSGGGFGMTSGRFRKAKVGIIWEFGVYTD